MGIVGLKTEIESLRKAQPSTAGYLCILDGTVTGNNAQPPFTGRYMAIASTVCVQGCKGEEAFAFGGCQTPAQLPFDTRVLSIL